MKKGVSGFPLIKQTDLQFLLSTNQSDASLRIVADTEHIVLSSSVVFTKMPRILSKSYELLQQSISTARSHSVFKEVAFSSQVSVTDKRVGERATLGEEVF